MLDTSEHLVIDTTFYQSAARTESVHSIPPGPCQDCPLAQKCSVELLACMAFHEFVMAGKAKREPERPTRGLFDWIFSGVDDDVPRGKLPDELKCPRSKRKSKQHRMAIKTAPQQIEVVRGKRKVRVLGTFPTIEEARAFLAIYPKGRGRMNPYIRFGEVTA